MQRNWLPLCEDRSDLGPMASSVGLLSQEVPQVSWFLREVNPVLLAFTLAVVAAACWTRWDKWVEERSRNR